MRFKAAATTLALLLALPSLTVVAQKVDLRGPAPEAGETTVMTVETDTDAGELAMFFAGQVMQGQMETDSSYVIEQTIDEVTDGSPSKVTSKFVKSKTTSKTTMQGQTQEQEDTSMQGAVMTQTKTADGWSTDLEGAGLPQEAKDMVKGAGYVDPRILFPENPVGVGDKWKIEDELMQSFMGQAGLPGAKFEGDISFEMVDLKNEDGNLIAVMHFEMDGTIKMDLSPDPNTKMDMVIKMKGDGSVYRNLTNYTTSQDFEGDMDMNMEMTAGGEKAMEMTAKMPMKFTQKQERK